AVWFVDASHGWIAGGNTLVHTQDGGDSWETQRSGGTMVIKDVFFLNRAVGWYVGEVSTQERIYFTQDGGASWTWEFTNRLGGGVNTGLLTVHGTGLSNLWTGGSNGTLMQREAGP
ncbi:MAG: hypothetical protein WED11_12570, partial [Natronospirillum sp.]